jgi:membrane glycosyltransferase
VLAILGVLAPSYLPWILPVVTGLILSIPIAVLTSRRDVGMAARRIGVFVTPEEMQPTKT